MSKAVAIDNKVFGSMSDAARYCGVNRSTVQRACRKGGAIWCHALKKYVRPKVVQEGMAVEDTEVVKAVFEVVQVECPHCGEYHAVKVSIS